MMFPLKSLKPMFLLKPPFLQMIFSFSHEILHLSTNFSTFFLVTTDMTIASSSPRAIASRLPRWAEASARPLTEIVSEGLTVWVKNGFVWKCCVPLKPMVLLIIIPIKNGYFIGNIPYFQTNPNGEVRGDHRNVGYEWDMHGRSAFPNPPNCVKFGDVLKIPQLEPHGNGPASHVEPQRWQHAAPPQEPRCLRRLSTLACGHSMASDVTCWL